MGRLASGQRINRASDDPAGLAVASSLRADSRVYGQGIRNVNDGISLLNVAEGALSALASITQRQIELAEQAANGTYSTNQRLSLHSENAALIQEFNRIVQTATFNGISTLDGTLFSGLRLQAGYGINGSISGNIGVELARTVGTGTFTAGQTVGNGGATGIYDTQTGDFNGDGKLDIAGASWTSGTWVSLGNGDGTFKAAVTSPGAAQTAQIRVVDINGDGRDDIVSVADSRISVLMSNGDGAFTLSASFSPTAFYSNGTLAVGDFNGDGKVDIGAQDFGNGTFDLLLGAGNGTFTSSSTKINFSEVGRGASVGDVNNDGRLDITIATDSGTILLLGNGDSTFSRSTPQSGSGKDTVLADVDGDGNLDLLSTKDTGANLLVSLGNGDGTFRVGGTYAFGVSPLTLSYQDIRTADFNGDGIPDVLITVRDSGSNAGTTQVLLGNSDGSFKARISFGALTDSISGTVGDFDGDGVTDVVVATAWDKVTYYDAQTTRSTLIARQDLRTQSDARSALVVNRAQLDRITQQLGTIGAFQSRASIAAENLIASRAGTDETASRIEDVDVAEETARLVRLQILQNVGTAILAQANQMPRLVLELIGEK